MPFISEMPTRITRPAPMLGEHSRELPREYRYSDAKIDAFIGEGAIEEADFIAL